LTIAYAAEPLGLGAAQADSEPREGRPVVTQLGTDASAITYWVDKPDGRHVVTTVDTVIRQDEGIEQHAVVRFSAVLAPGQAEMISVPVAIGEPHRVLRIRRLGDQIEIAYIAETT
jgi:hypothetical protein